MNNLYKWNPINRELPSESDRYIVTVESGWVGEDYYDVNRQEWFENQYRVIAWMPFPEKYKGVTDNAI